MKNNNSNTLQAFWVGAGSFASFTFVLLSSAILSRYFNKEDYGTYRQVLYVYNTLLVIFTLGLPRAFSYFLPRVTMAQGMDMVRKMTNLFYVMGGVFSVSLFFAAPLIAQLLNNEELTLALKIFSPVPVLMLPTMGIESIYATYRKSHFIAIYTILSRLFMLCCVALPVLLFDVSYIGAIVGFVVSSFLIFTLALYLKNFPFRGLTSDKSPYSYRQILGYTLPLMYAGIFGIVIASADQFFISRYFGTEVFAVFANGSLELPFVGMVVGACSVVLSPLFSKYAHEHDNPSQAIYPLWISSFEKTAKLIYPMIIFCWFYAEAIMTILFSNEYIDSAIYFRIKLFANLFTLITYGPLVLAIGKTKYYLNVHLYGMIILVILEYISVKAIHSSIAITAISVICQVGRIFFMLALIAKYLNKTIVSLFPIRLLMSIILPSIIILMGIQFVFGFIQNPILSITVGLSIYAVLYLLWAYFAKIDYNIIYRPIINI